VPAAGHPVVRAQRAAVGEAGQQGLAAGDDLADGRAGQVDRGQLWHPQFALGEGGASQGVVHPLGGQPEARAT